MKREWSAFEEGVVSVYRRITVHLYEPTRDGDTEIHLVSNLPKRVAATSLANLYRDRWPKFLRNTGKQLFRKSLPTTSEKGLVLCHV